MNTLIRNCKFAFRCEKKWENLKPSGIPTVRHCTDCKRDVHYCQSDEDLATAIRENLCVAIDDPNMSFRTLGELAVR